MVKGSAEGELICVDGSVGRKIKVWIFQVPEGVPVGTATSQQLSPALRQELQNTIPHPE